MELPASNGVDLGWSWSNELLVDNGEPMALTDADVLALLPEWVRRTSSPVRDAVVRATRRFWQRVQVRIGRSLGALQSPRNARGLRLTEHGEIRKRARAPLETEPAYRERLLRRPARITPNAIRDAVLALVAAVWPVAPVLFEPATEGCFVQAEGQYAWTCFVQPEAGPLLFAEMPDNAIPAGVWVNREADLARPVFVVLLDGPLYTLTDALHASTEGASGFAVDGDFVGANTPLTVWSFLSSEIAPLEEQVRREVEARRGGGVLWWLHIVPNLGGAL